MIRFVLYTAFWIGGFVVMVSCGASRPSALRLPDPYCEPPISYRYDSAYYPKPTEQVLRELESGLLARFSKHDLLLANACGVLPLLKEIDQLASQNTLEARMEVLQKRQQMQNRLLVAISQISSLAAELDCEGERADQIADYLDQRDERRIRRLTILSAALGAVTTVVTTLVPQDVPGTIIGVGGGVISAGLGGVAAFQSNQSVLFRHSRNLLTDVWQESPRSSVYPPLVWYVLTEKTFSNGGQFSVCHNIRQRWQNYILGSQSDGQIALYFGEGGHYQADDLHNRANMLNQLQSSIRSISQDLQSLLLALSH